MAQRNILKFTSSGWGCVARFVERRTSNVTDASRATVQRYTKPGCHGFTLTEMLLVILIISLMAGVGGGLYVGTHKRMLVEKASREFLMMAEYARIMAVEQQIRYTMQLDAANNRCWLFTTQWDIEAGQNTEVIVKDLFCKPVEFEGDVKFEDVVIAPIGLETRADAEQGDTVFFLPDGTAQSAVVQIGDGKTHYAIGISAATGKATMYFGTAKEVKTSSVDLDAEE